MKNIIFIFLLIGLFFNVEHSFSQKYRPNVKSYFGLQFKPLIPLGLVGDRPFTIKNNGFESEISSVFGYTYGGIVRIGLTELLAIETGFNYIRRNFRANYTVIDSNIVAIDNIGYINFEVPANLLVYVKLSNEVFMNVAGGASFNFNPSNVRSHITPDPFRQDIFIFEGRRYNFFDFNINAEVGFEYRTERSGFFYLGMTGRIPVSPILDIATEYRYDTHKLVSYGKIRGATVAFSLKYFFHNSTQKRGVQLEKGPIER